MNDEQQVPLSLVKDLIDALDDFWVYIEARNHVSNTIREAHPDYLTRGDRLEAALNQVKVRIKDWE